MPAATIRSIQESVARVSMVNACLKVSGMTSARCQAMLGMGSTTPTPPVQPPATGLSTACATVSACKATLQGAGYTVITAPMGRGWDSVFNSNYFRWDFSANKAGSQDYAIVPAIVPASSLDSDQGDPNSAVGVLAMRRLIAAVNLK